ncbi:MAG: alpha/beta hydrolase [Hoeflea sp.]|uniref:alpha/beta hydrolase n=1 Tax=Hoeflea sp. TaxID=1940281 RepID=UPI001DECCF00|nr:alpha/beta hydrolase [Hoeflea sp.]MBU4531571.1 alpha/beta hydrolase [Alphaproteobacteria bacterium]MBU4544428.1 alpha/beta hydrolase [Alphaproteobacteria bacterium]MBU4550335.1 alpha/beta hydrolase [Alphaproteobacteria bacterium]MBV1724847.1 alpha/beta hydrolase [Hoeflea sp.]MBV1760867.1 alpha/beta hydrolase [Hoeflea sp.]
MTQPDASRLDVGKGEDKRSIAVLSRKADEAGAGLPGVVWLGGYRSDMTGSKAEALCRQAGLKGQACLRFDYSGHGASGGDFRQGTISRWLEESLAAFEHCTTGPQILVGSSMGGWIALRMVQVLKARGMGGLVAGLVLIAPAPDFTLELMEPELTDAQRASLERDGFYEEPTPYGPDPNVFTRALFEDGRKNRVLDGLIDTGAPVHIIQGMADPDVPWRHALRLVEHLPSDNVTLTLIRDGDHRLSRDEDIARILGAVDTIAANS